MLTTEGPTKSTKSVKSGKPRTLGATATGVWASARVGKPPPAIKRAAVNTATGVTCNQERSIMGIL